jgi:phospholipase C
VDPFGGGFQFHHQAFAYYVNFAPFKADGTPNPKTNSLLNPHAHLQDEDQFFADLAAGQLPAVSFIKPIGAANEHPGYAGLLKGGSSMSRASFTPSRTAANGTTRSSS